MSGIDWDELARNAREETNKKFREQITTLVRLDDRDIRNILSKSTVEKDEFIRIIQIVQDRTMENNKKAEAIEKLDKGLRTLIAIVDRVL